MEAKEKDPLLESLSKDNPGVEVPPEVEIRLRHHLATLRERIEAPKGKEWFPRVSGWGTALRYVTPVVALILIGFIGYLVMSGGSSSRAYADVVEKLRNAHSMTYTMTAWVEGAPKVPMEWILKEPHYQRVSDPMGGYWIFNMGEKRGLMVSTRQKQYMVTDLSDASPELLMESDIVHEIRSLPERADKNLGKKEIDGRTVQGFRVTEQGVDKTLWVDVETGDLVLMEGELVNAPGWYFIIENIQFDIEYDDSFFSLEPPPGFTSLKIDIDWSLPDEQDLIDALDMFTSHHVDGLFPDSGNPVEIFTSLTDLITAGKYKEPDTEGMAEEEKLQVNMKKSMILERFLQFIMKLKPENDIHYTGKGIKRGAADAPVFWYKPDGSETYRVVYADLDVRDVAPEDLPPVPVE